MTVLSTFTPGDFAVDVRETLNALLIEQKPIPIATGLCGRLRPWRQPDGIAGDITPVKVKTK